MSFDLASAFETKLKNSDLIRPGSRVFVACSGGPDSVALVHLLLTLRAKWRLRLGILHFHHGLRGRLASRDLRFAEHLARSHKLIFVSARGDVRRLAKDRKLSLEEAAREARYHFFEEAARRRRIPFLALAHTLDDQAETVMMRMIQGTGLQGLQGIREKRNLGRTVLIRPLLNFSKKQILHFLKDNGFDFCRDETNESAAFLRNRIRRKLIPLLEKEFNPRVKEALARIPSVVTDEVQAVEALVPEAFRGALVAAGRRKIVFCRSAFRRWPAAVQFRILRQALEKLDARSGLPFDAWEEIRAGFLRRSFRCSLKRDLDLDVTQDEIKVYKKNPAR